MGFCFFLVCSGNDHRFYPDRILEFFCGSSRADQCVYIILQMLTWDCGSIDRKQKKENQSVLLLSLRLSSLNLA